jgi:hypothetical protein
MMFCPKWEFVLEMSKFFQILKEILQKFCKHLKVGISISAFGMHATDVILGLLLAQICIYQHVSCCENTYIY